MTPSAGRKLHLYKKYKLKLSIVIIYFSCVPVLQGASFVYNLRIAQTTRQKDMKVNYGRPGTVVGTWIDQYRAFYTGTYENTYGALGMLIYSPSLFHARIDVAVAHLRSHTPATGSSFSRTQFDDVLLTAGYGHEFSKDTKMTFEGLLGIPTHRDLSLENPQFGTGHCGLGAQIDASHVYYRIFGARQILLGAARFIHFFPRTVFYRAADQTTQYRYDIGNLLDLFLTFNSRWPQHRIEVGYNPTFSFKASIRPHLDDVGTKADYIRSSVFATYQYVFLLFKTEPSAITFGIGYGRDHIPKQYGNRYIVNLWVFWGSNI
jgi:hypothetical protein